MDPKTILILGGYGNTGLLLARGLLEKSHVRLILAGRNLEKAEKAAAELGQTFGTHRVRGLPVDATDPEGLKKALEGVTLLLVASGTANHVKEVATAALEAQVDYLDIQYSTPKLKILQSLRGEIEKAGPCFITEAGFHPGLLALLVRYGAGYFDQMDRAYVASVIRMNWDKIEASEGTVLEFIEEFKYFQSLYFKGGKWKLARMGGAIGARNFDFGKPFGSQYCVPMMFEEMRALPEMFPSLRETGFFVAGFNWFTDMVALPLVMMGLKILPQKAIKALGEFFFWSLKTFSRKPFGTVLKLEAEGQKDGVKKKLEVILSHEDGYVLTAQPVIACILQYLEGTIKKPGLHFMALLAEPKKLMEDMKDLGLSAEERVS